MSAGATAQFFAPMGPLAAHLPEYEERREQVQVAEQVEAALTAGESLVAEAGTGCGKTLAYLVPAVQSGLRVVVSTGTKNLQEQILGKDLPLLERCVGHSFDVQVMKGRGNYLCEARVERVARQGVLPGVGEAELLGDVLAWRQITHTGDRAELHRLPERSALWRELSVSSEQCRGRRCDEYERCWVTRMRRRAQECQLLIVNHHLYFADAALRQRLGEVNAGILPPHDAVIFDEAHEVDEIAAQHFGYQVSETRLHELGRDASRALSEAGRLAGAAASLLGEIDLRARRLFDAMPFGSGRLRLQPDAIPSGVRAAHSELDALLATLEATLDVPGDAGEPLAQLGQRVARLAFELAFVLGMPERHSSLWGVEPIPDAEAADDFDDADAGGATVPFVRYSERFGRQRLVVARPIDVAPLIRRTLTDRSAIFVSATLAVGHSFEHFRSRVGLAEANDAAELLVSSPFDFEAQARLYVPQSLAAPETPQFAAAAAAQAVELVSAAGGGAFVLCTSHRMLAVMRDALRAGTSVEVLTQGEAPRGHLLQRFCDNGHAALVATMSFWRGVDVPGDALRLVVIDRLPFASPADPVLAARLDFLRQNGQSPFASHQLPQAALLLRQGFGRLIRRRSDRGLVAILDPRLRSRSYGKMFLRSLPPAPVVGSLDEAQQYLASIRPAAAPTLSA